MVTVGIGLFRKSKVRRAGRVNSSTSPYMTDESSSTMLSSCIGSGASGATHDSGVINVSCIGDCAKWMCWDHGIGMLEGMAA